MIIMIDRMQSSAQGYKPNERTGPLLPQTFALLQSPALDIGMQSLPHPVKLTRLRPCVIPK